MPPTTCPRTTQKSAAGKEYKKISPGVVEVFQEKLFWLWISQGGCCTEGGGTSKANWPPLNPSPSPNPSRAAPFSKKGRKNLEKNYLERPVSDKEARAKPCHKQNKYRRPHRAQQGQQAHSPQRRARKAKQGISKPTDKTKTNLNLHTLPQTTSHTFLLSYDAHCHTQISHSTHLVHIQPYLQKYHNSHQNPANQP